MPQNWLDTTKATTFEVAEFLARIPVAIFPIGATEQHGPHLPIGTDALLAEEFGRRVAERSGGLLLPVLPLGYSWVWRDRPGSLTLAFDTLRDIVRDIVLGMERQGVRAMLLLTTHMANDPPLKYAVRELADESDVALLHLCFPNLQRAIGDELRSPVWRGDVFHAEEIETSLMLAMHPELVRMERAVAEYPDAPATYGADATAMGDLSVSGVFGDATVADADRGRRWLDLLAAEMAALWREFLTDRDRLPEALRDATH